MKKKKKQKKIKFTYEPATDIPEKERERRLDEAYAILFDAVLRNWNKEDK